tara:strand:- start:12072 stop:12548 length:477 start_codon:yes stop_codon:yes gene_type:complete
MSLINGMDDIMTFIKNQGILVKKLTEENKKLTEENKKLKEDAEGLYDHEGAIACLDLVDGQEHRLLKSKMANAEIRGAAKELNAWRDELMKAFKSFEEHDAEDVTREDLDPEFVGAWISDALKRDQQHHDMNEERQKAMEWVQEAITTLSLCDDPEVK